MTNTNITKNNSPAIPRPLPATNQDSHPYWSGGEHNELRIFCCQDCRYYIHPPVRFCPQCESRKVEPEAVSGHGTVVSFTVNHKQWLPNLPVPYVLALIAINEQEDVHLVTNIVNCDPNDVYIDMPVSVIFEQHEDLWVPLFQPQNTPHNSGQEQGE